MLTSRIRFSRIHAALCAAVIGMTAPTALTASGSTPDGAFDLTRPDISAFVDEVAARNGFDRNEIIGLLSQGVRQPRIIEAISRPAERVSPWWEYRNNFLTEKRIDEGLQFWQQHRERLDRIELETGVSAAYIVAIIGVETFYGRITGRWRVLDALMTLGFDYQPRQVFFRSELEQFLLLAREEKLDPAAVLGSYAGAMGAPQFMPSSYRRFAVDGGGDSSRNLFVDWDDVIASVGNYLKVHGWQPGLPVLVEASAADPNLMATLDPRNLTLDQTVAGLRSRGLEFDPALPASAAAILVPAELADRPNVRIGFNNFHVITRYNRSIRYAMAVHDLAQSITTRAYAAEPNAPPS
jgi:membrane-bound lytic murein transglycosylase B